MRTVADRIEASVTRVTETGCWVWQKALTELGYARIGLKGKARHAHKVSYETFVGPVPKGLELDHVCKVRCCVNPAHLEPVTRYENMRRSSVWQYRKVKTHCQRGHELVGDNVYTAPSLGNKYLCRACKNMRQRGLLPKGE
jgi:HNH endonuclease